MDAVQSCNVVRQSLVESGLHYFINESPHSLWITIRKKFINAELVIENIAQKESSNSSDIVQSKDEYHKSEYKTLKETNDKLVVAYNTLREDFVKEISEHKETKDTNDNLIGQIHKKDEVIHNLKLEIKNIESNQEVSENSDKKSVKIIKGKDKEIHDLKKENYKTKEDIEKLDRELKELKAKVNKDKKDLERKTKKQEKKDFLNNMKTENKAYDVECDQCDAKVSTMPDLRMHMRVHHMKQSTTQTDGIILAPEKSMYEISTQTCDSAPIEIEFVKYPCHYCGNTIESKEHLTEHKKKCHGSFIQKSFVKSVPLKSTFPPIGFESGQWPIGFPSVKTTCLYPLYPSLAKN